MRPHLVFLVLAVTWHHVIYGEESVASLQESDRENGTSSSMVEEKRVARSDLGGPGESEEDPPPFWANRGRSLSIGGERLRRHEPFFVEEPQWLLLEEQPTVENEIGECEESRKRRTNRLSGLDDAFWPSRGRRSGYKRPMGQEGKDGRGAHDISEVMSAFKSKLDTLLNDEEPLWKAKSHGDRQRSLEAQSIEEPFWASRGRSIDLNFRDRRSGLSESLEEPFWAARGRRSEDLLRERRAETFSGEEPFWAARGRRSGDLVRGRRTETFSGEVPFWAARGRRSGDIAKGRHAQAFSGEEPFWAARGRRAENRREGLHGTHSGSNPSWTTRTHHFEINSPVEHTENKILQVARGRRSPYQGDNLQSFSVEEPFWAARGKRGFLESISAEEPFWAARGKKQFPQMNTWNLKLWPLRSNQEIAAADNNVEDESFWTALENKLVGRGTV